MSLLAQYSDCHLEAGVDEAGRGCLAGPVVAGAVILPKDFTHELLDDSKKLNHNQRELLRPIIIEQAVAWHIGIIPSHRIDQVNILNATYEAMHEAIAGLAIQPEFIAIDGNRFRPFGDIPYSCVIKGDGKYKNIAAASILAKTFRDELMVMLDYNYPEYGWKQNKGYPTKAHKAAIRDHGPTDLHRKSFNWQIQPSLFDQ